MDRPKVCAVVSCGATKRDLEPGEAIEARLLYDSSVHTCKDRYGRHSDGYYIMSAEFGLVHHATEISTYDKTLENMTDCERKAWASKVTRALQDVLSDGDFDAVVFIGGKTYVGALEPHFDRLPVAVLTPWQTDDWVTGVGRGMAWCNDESHWPEHIDTLEEIGEIVSPAFESDAGSEQGV
ncbi:DUF6884 domain-containing protein [Natronosalvus amylolyticus]|uniref:DUF6884 domain-containing protein n=1 Tax=Natronosalvus amylolyticus TaxID=2961994 RepID=UPI0020C99ED0|nr:DUF6884 domain-containing protein [Natronosalvus amylolyticus]